MRKKELLELFKKYSDKTITQQEQESLLGFLRSGDFIESLIAAELEKESSEWDFDAKKHVLKQITSKLDLVSKFSAKQKYGFDLWIRIAAAVAIIISLSSLFFRDPVGQQTKDNNLQVEVLRGQKTNLVLPDGTRVWVNSNSLLSFGNRFNTKERVVNLEGEAYFEVQPDISRPFIVSSGHLEVKALGTSFVVHNYRNDQRSWVMLREGKVAVSASGREISLNSSETVSLWKSDGRIQLDKEVDPLRYIGWIEGMLYFDNQTFEQIATTLERTYNVKIEFLNSDLKRHCYSGWIGNNSLESILHVLALTTPFTYKYKNEVVELK